MFCGLGSLASKGLTKDADHEVETMLSDAKSSINSNPKVSISPGSKTSHPGYICISPKS